MKNLKKFIVVSALALAVVSAPLVGLAHFESKENGNNAKIVKVEQRANLKINKEIRKENKQKEKDERKDAKKSSNRVSFWSRMFGGWFGLRAKAAINTSPKPSIFGIKSPTVLKVGEEGTWTVKAYDPQNGPLEYAVDWGDDSLTPLAAKMSTSAFVQTSTFTHAYAKPGKYTVKFTVTNEAGFKTTSNVTVHVVESPRKRAPVIISLDGDTSIEAGDTETVTVHAYDPKNSPLSYSVDWGDSMAITALSTSMPVYVQSATFTHVYANPGTYTATFTVENEAGLKTSSSMNIVVSSS